MGPTLPKLATELVELVSHCLERADILSLRLVCKELYQKSLCAFGALFNTIRTDLSQTSFQRLRAICSHEMHLYVKTLLIEAGDDGRLGQGVRWRRHSSDHLNMLSPGPQTLQHLLVHNLPNCRSFHIRSPGGMEDESSPLTVSHAVGLILLLVPSLPTTSPVNSFIVDSSRANGTDPLDPNKLPMAQCRQPSFIHAWAHVQELVLDQSLRPTTFAWTLDLVLHAVRLRTLSLDLGFDHDNLLTERLCAVDSTPRFLESLSLSRGHTTMVQLSQLIEQSRGTLRALTLRLVSISRFGDWPILLGRLRSLAPLLESISVNWLRAYDEEPCRYLVFPGLVSDHVVPGSGGRSVTWMTRKWNGEKRIFRASYRGPNVGEALAMLVKAADTIWLEKVPA